jgi:hypothetical protein
MVRDLVEDINRLWFPSDGGPDKYGSTIVVPKSSVWWDIISLGQRSCECLPDILERSLTVVQNGWLTLTIKG